MLMFTLSANKSALHLELALLHKVKANIVANSLFIILWILKKIRTHQANASGFCILLIISLN